MWSYKVFPTTQQFHLRQLESERQHSAASQLFNLPGSDVIKINFNATSPCVCHINVCASAPLHNADTRAISWTVSSQCEPLRLCCPTRHINDWLQRARVLYGARVGEIIILSVHNIMHFVAASLASNTRLAVMMALRWRYHLVSREVLTEFPSNRQWHVLPDGMFMK